MNPKIQVSPNQSLIDSKIEITITDLIPNDYYTLKAQMKDNLGTRWESYAQFQTDDDGKIDLSTAHPLEGTYSEPDPHGLLWSMIPVSSERPNKRTSLKPLEYQLTLTKDDVEIKQTFFTRRLVSTNIVREPILEEGLNGTYFYHPEAGQRPTVICLGGSEGGLRESQAALLASHGFNTLALAYYGMENLPTELVQIPIESIEKAIDWVMKQPSVNADKIGMIGTSKGGELALLCASMFPSIKAVVGFVPSGFVYPGIGQASKGLSSWQYNGKPIPFALGKIPSEEQERIKDSTRISYRNYYKYLAKGEDHAEIPVEKINGPILLISGGDDQLWPSDWLSEKVINRLEKNNHPYTYKHLNYPKAGHSFAVPTLPTTTSTETSFGENVILKLGGTPKDNAHAQMDAWQQIKEFFSEALK